MSPTSYVIRDDTWFDDQFPRDVRERSRQYWTPVAVAARVASIFCDRGAKRVLDVGCGPGKFCIVAGFAENTSDRHDRFDDTVRFSTVRFGSELLHVEGLLERAPLGTVVVTYHGLGGPIPSSYELIGDERSGSDRIRTWVQGPQRQSRWAWLETLGSVTRVSRSDMQSALASLMCEDIH